MEMHRMQRPGETVMHWFLHRIRHVQIGEVTFASVSSTRFYERKCPLLLRRELFCLTRLPHPPLIYRHWKEALTSSG